MSKFAAAMSILGDAGIDYRRIMQNPARAAKIAAAVDDGPEAVVDLANAILRGGRPATPPAPAGRDPMSFEDRIASNTTLRKGLEELGISTEGMSQEQVMEAAAKAFKADGAPRGRPKQAAPPPPLPSSPLAGMVAGRRPRSTEDSIRELAKPADQVAAESIASQFDRMTGAAPARQMELQFGREPTGIIPYGVRGPGVPVGGVRGMGSLYNPGTEMIPAPLRGLPAPEPTGLSVIGERGLIRAPMRGLPGPEPTGLIVRDMPPARTPDLDMPSRLPDDPPPARPRIGPKTKAAAAVAAAGAGAAALAPERLGDEGLVSGGEADLVAESRPAPQVDATADVPEPTVAQAPRDYSMEARALINRLNDMRRAAGGEVPEARAMIAEINRLLELGNQTRRATAVAAPQDDASRLFQQAQSLIDQVNQMYRQGMTPNSPEVQRAMAQVRQLQAQGDAIRNRRAG